MGPRAGLNGCEDFATTGMRSPHREARTESLHRLSYRGPQIVENTNTNLFTPLSKVRGRYGDLHEIMLPRQQTVLPRQQTVLPRQQIVLPRQQIVLPRQQTVLPRQQTVLPRQLSSTNTPYFTEL